MCRKVIEAKILTKPPIFESIESDSVEWKSVTLNRFAALDTRAFSCFVVEANLNGDNIRE